MFPKDRWRHKYSRSSPTKICLANIPPNITKYCQPLDLTANEHAKCYLKNKFSTAHGTGTKFRSNSMKVWILMQWMFSNHRLLISTTKWLPQKRKVHNWKWLESSWDYRRNSPWQQKSPCSRSISWHRSFVRWKYNGKSAFTSNLWPNFGGKTNRLLLNCRWWQWWFRLGKICVADHTKSGNER